MRLRYKLPLAFALTTLVFAGIVALVAALALRGVYLDRLEDDMSLQARQFAAVLELEASDSNSATGTSLQTLTDRAGDAGDLRLTLIARDGTVLGDSQADPTTLDNHATRPEVAQALAGHEGRARRLSATLKQQEVYVAVPLPESEAPWSKGVVRAALPASRVDATVAASWRVPLIVWAVLLLPTLAISFLLTRSITRPVQRLQDMTGRVAGGDLAYRNSIRRNDELGDLAGSLNKMAEQLQAQVDRLATEEERSGRVLAAMTEGVIVMDADGRLVRANPAAGRILQAPLEGGEGKPLVVTARSFPAQALAERSRKTGGTVAEIVGLPGQRYAAVEAIPLRSPGSQGVEATQTLFVIRDETARLAIDRIRKDFATNVSHELKTPLAGLSLLAETLKHALEEEPEQARVFVDRMAAEVARLVGLAGDLLTLSKLEEPGGETTERFTATDMGLLAEETVSELLPLAEAKQQEISVSAAPGAVVLGDDVALSTLIRNLVDNAIRYTETGGHIAVRVQCTDGHPGRPLGGAGGAGRRRGDPSRPTNAASSSASTGWTKRGRAIPVGPGSASASSGTWPSVTVARLSVTSTLGSGSTFKVLLPAAE